MAERIELFTVTMTAGTAQNAPGTTNMTFKPGVVERFEFVVPAGVAGLAGFQLAYNGTVIIPASGTSFVLTDDEKIVWDVSKYPAGGQWQVSWFNTDIFDHNVYVRVLLNELPDQQSQVMLPIPVG